MEGGSNAQTRDTHSSSSSTGRTRLTEGGQWIEEEPPDSRQCQRVYEQPRYVAAGAAVVTEEKKGSFRRSYNIMQVFAIASRRCPNPRNGEAKVYGQGKAQRVEGKKS